jgi:hypothetical protein
MSNLQRAVERFGYTMKEAAKLAAVIPLGLYDLFSKGKPSLGAIIWIPVLLLAAPLLFALAAFVALIQLVIFPFQAANAIARDLFSSSVELDIVDEQKLTPAMLEAERILAERALAAPGHFSHPLAAPKSTHKTPQCEAEHSEEHATSPRF